MSDRTDEFACRAEECREQVEQLRHAVFGNGSPEKSLLVRIQRVEEMLTNIQRISWLTLSAIGAVAIVLLKVWAEKSF